MSMDLWYDLAIEQLADLDAHVAELIEEETAKTPVKVKAEAVAVVAVDFF